MGSVCSCSTSVEEIGVGGTQKHKPTRAAAKDHEWQQCEIGHCEREIELDKLHIEQTTEVGTGSSQPKKATSHTRHSSESVVLPRPRSLSCPPALEVVPVVQLKRCSSERGKRKLVLDMPASQQQHGLEDFGPRYQLMFNVRASCQASAARAPPKRMTTKSLGTSLTGSPFLRPNSSSASLFDRDRWQPSLGQHHTQTRNGEAQQRSLDRIPERKYRVERLRAVNDSPNAEADKEYREQQYMAYMHAAHQRASELYGAPGVHQDIVKLLTDTDFLCNAALAFGCADVIPMLRKQEQEKRVREGQAQTVPPLAPAAAEGEATKSRPAHEQSEQQRPMQTVFEPGPCSEIGNGYLYLPPQVHQQQPPRSASPSSSQLESTELGLDEQACAEDGRTFSPFYVPWVMPDLGTPIVYARDPLPGEARVVGEPPFVPIPGYVDPKLLALQAAASASAAAAAASGRAHRAVAPLSATAASATAAPPQHQHRARAAVARRPADDYNVPANSNV